MNKQHWAYYYVHDWVDNQAQMYANMVAARNKGITGFFLSCWIDHQEEIDQAFAASVPSGMQMGILLENPERTVAERCHFAAQLLDKYENHPRLIKVQSNPKVPPKPPIIVYSPAWTSGDVGVWSEGLAPLRSRAYFIGDVLKELMMDIFDGITNYNPATMMKRNMAGDVIQDRASYDQMRLCTLKVAELCKSQKKFYFPPIMAHFDDSANPNRDPHTVLEFRNGELFWETVWAADQCDPQYAPIRILVTANEQDEQSHFLGTWAMQQIALQMVGVSQRLWINQGKPFADPALYTMPD